MICVMCKHAELEEGRGTSVFERNGMTLVIQDVPKLICPNCGEEYTEEEMTERLLQIAEEAERNGVLMDVRKFQARNSSMSNMFE